MTIAAEHDGYHPPAERHVLDQQNLERRRKSIRLRFLVCLIGFERKAESCPAFPTILCGQCSSHAFGDSARHSQPETEPLVVISFTSLERLEQAGQVHIPQSGTAVLDRDRD